MSEKEQRPPGRTRRRLATYGPAFLVFLLAICTLLGINAERARDAWVTHSREVQLSLERTLSDVRDAEVGQRGYLLTHDSAFLVPYNRGISAVQYDAASVQRLTMDNPIQKARVQKMRRLIDQRTQRLHDNLNLGLHGEFDFAEVSARLDSGRVLMDSLRASVGQLVATEDTLLVRRESQTLRNERSTILIVVIGSVLAAVLSVLMNVLIGAYSKEQERAGARMAEQNTRLADQADQMADQALHLQEQATELEMQRDELQDATTQLEARTEAAEEANRAKSDFLRAMSHELRTPLNAIGGYTQLIELGIRGPVTHEQREDLARITRSQRHLLSLINDVLNYAKLEAGRVNYEMLDISMHDMILAMDDLVRPQMLAKHIDYICDPGARDLLVYVDPEKALQIMLNLLSNAVKFTPDNGTIEIRVEDKNGTACVHVRDSGIGVPADKQEAIFEPFVQVGRTLSGTSEGTGLGLSISRDLARGMGGDLMVESEPGNGSTFTLCLRTTTKIARED